MTNAHIPPLRFHALTPAYDALVRWTSAECEFRATMIGAIDVAPGGRLVDVGCGTGTLALMLTAALPAVEVIGVDADSAALGIARAKAAQRGAQIRFRQADARALPFDDATLDAATASLFFHHLDDLTKHVVLREISRCLRPGGSFVVADWDRPDGPINRASFSIVRLLDGFEVTRAHASGAFPAFLRRAGFDVVEDLARIRAPLGTVGVWRCHQGATTT